MTTRDFTPGDDPAHPVVFMILIAPFGVMGGYLTVAIAYLLAQAGLTVAEVAALVAASFIPQTWKFLWAPVADTTLSRKRWYVIASVVSAFGIFATGAIPATPRSLPLLYIVVIVSNFAVTFLAMSTESLMAYDTPGDRKGRAGGWFQAGNLGGGGLGGGAGLWMAQNLSEPWIAGGVLAVVCLACCAALLFIREPPPTPRASSYLRDLGSVLRDLWSVAKSRSGALALLICFLPLGTGAASGLWSAVADDWHASADTVALVTGVASGFVSAAGCFIGGWICDRMDRKYAYGLFGVALAVCAVLMALAPRTEPMFVIYTTAYSLLSGFSYAAFSAVVLEVIGRGAAATKYNLFASLSNMPIAYMTVVDGWAHTRWGAGGMLYTEAVVGVAAMGVFVAASALRPGRRAGAPAGS
ncbi:MAG TPA: MFS transporter [Casimicrobiaceae bacterium]|nr:MFS transporter [Casimicrobiaceae bacterium]